MANLCASSLILWKKYNDGELMGKITAKEVKSVEILGVKEKFVVLKNMMHQLSGLKTDTDLYRISRWVQQLRKANLLNEKERQ